MSGTDLGGSTASAFSDDALSGAIGKIMEHPELISMVASALGVNAPASGTEGAASNKSAPQPEVALAQNDVLAALMPRLGKLSEASAREAGFKHEPLLCALKPYLSKERCETIDYIIRISKLSGLIGGMR